jgi:hypothetical protein
MNKIENITDGDALMKICAHSGESILLAGIP